MTVEGKPSAPPRQVQLSVTEAVDYLSTITLTVTASRALLSFSCLTDAGSKETRALLAHQTPVAVDGRVRARLQNARPGRDRRFDRQMAGTPQPIVLGLVFTRP